MWNNKVLGCCIEKGVPERCLGPCMTKAEEEKCNVCEGYSLPRNSTCLQYYQDIEACQSSKESFTKGRSLKLGAKGAGKSVLQEAEENENEEEPEENENGDSAMNLLQQANANLEKTNTEAIGKMNARAEANLIANETEEGETNCMGNHICLQICTAEHFI